MEEKETGSPLFMKQILLSRRLQMLARMVTPGNRVADIGCDHGFLSIYLVQAGIAPRVIAMDVREGPLRAAREHIATYGMETWIETRLSDGLCACRPGEVDAVVCAGMGGRLMERILRQGMEQICGLKELILQPQSEWEEFRVFLREAGFVTDREDMVVEAGKYYPAMRVHWRGANEGRASWREEGNDAAAQKLCDMFGEGLLKTRHPVLRQYLDQRRKLLQQLQQQLEQEDTPRAGSRLEQLQAEQTMVETAMGYF